MNIVNTRYALEALHRYGELQRAVGFVRGFMAGKEQGVQSEERKDNRRGDPGSAVKS